MHCIWVDQFKTMIVVIVYYISYERSYFSLSDDVFIDLIDRNYKNYKLISDFLTFIF